MAGAVNRDFWTVARFRFQDLRESRAKAAFWHGCCLLEELLLRNALAGMCRFCGEAQRFFSEPWRADFVASTARCGP